MANEFHIASKAKDLAKHTFQLTSNCNKFPKKYRFSLVDKLQNKSLELYDAILEANRCDFSTSNNDRRRKQQEAINFCDEMLFYIELSIDFSLMNIEGIEYWAKLVSDIKHMLIAWKQKEQAK